MKILSLYTIYNPDEKLLEQSIQKTQNSVDKIWISDNSAIEHSYLSTLSNKIVYFHFNKNVGIAEGQNGGIKYAIDNGYDLILFFDQDSCFDLHFINKLLNNYIIIKKIDPNMCAIGPMAINRDSKQILNKQNNIKMISIKGKLYYEISAMMSSASLVEVDAFKKAGLMDESLFIDNVDYEWSWRCRYLLHKKLYITTDCILEHQLGEGDFNFCGLNFHKPSIFRMYYQYRNYVLLMKRRYVPLKWKLRETSKCLIKIILWRFIYKDKKYFKQMLHGIRDGLFTHKPRYIQN